jgi:hypothetical protein
MPYRLLGMALRRTVVVVIAVAFAACSSDGAVPTTVTSGETATTASTQLLPSSTTSITQPTTTTVTVPSTLSDSGQSGFEDALGTSERACVDVDQIVANEEPEMVGPEDNRQPVFDIRSGEILAGNFALVVGQWSTEWPDGAAKIYWVPFDHRVATTGPLEVSVEPLDSNHPAVVQTFEQIASNAAGVFWPSGTKFPQPGRYRLTATAPGHWGCFELTV